MKAQRVLIAHVPYEIPGGEDRHVATLEACYQELGLQTMRYPSPSHRSQPLSAIASLLPGRAPAGLKQVISDFQPRFIHLHNAFPSLGPGFFEWAKSSGIPVVMTVHNHRFYCANGLALRDGRECKDCLDASWGWRPLLRNCNESVTKSAYHSLALTRMRTSELYLNAVHRFIAPSPYIQEELIRTGVERDRIRMIFHPVGPLSESEANGAGSASQTPPQSDFLFVGRLSREKGIRELLVALELLPDFRATIIGDGPERPIVERAVAALGSRIRFKPNPERSEIVQEILGTRLGVAPSICNESFGLFPLECMWAGKRCVVPLDFASRWQSEPPFFGVAARTTDSGQLAKTLRESLQLPKPSDSQVKQLRTIVSRERFQRELHDQILSDL